MATATKVTHREVIDYLKGLPAEMRELVLQLAEKEIAEAEGKKAALSARLAKARKSIGKKKAAVAGHEQQNEQASPAPVTADPNVQREVAEQIPAQRGRRVGHQHDNQVMAAAVE